MEKAYTVTSYDIDHLKSALSKASGVNSSIIEGKFHSGYFREYFSALGAKTIVIEANYVDHDYLDDYTAFYVKCLTNYPRTCKRLHFFASKFSERQLNYLLSGKRTRLTLPILQEAYLASSS